MARKALMVKAAREAKFSARTYSRCRRCGRSRAFMRRFQLCRICFRELACQGRIPGIVKASW